MCSLTFFSAEFLPLWLFSFFKNMASTVIVALAIPTSIIGTFSIMYSFGFNMNTMTMLALSLCVGLVIDDAIVVLEIFSGTGNSGKTSSRLHTKEPMK